MTTRRVTARQQNSRICFVCGLKNPGGVSSAILDETIGRADDP